MKTLSKNSEPQKVNTAALLFILMTSVTAFAQVSDGSSTTSIDNLETPESTLNLSHHNSGWSLNYVYGFVAYSEPGLMSETGSLDGVGFTYIHAFRENPVVLRFEGDYSYGQLNYVGSTWTGTPLTDTTSDNLINTRALLGVQAQLTDHINAMPFLGVAARYLNDDIQGSGGYEREITYFYAPVGAEFKFAVADDWAVSCAGEYDYFLSGTVDSHLDQSDSSYPNVTTTQSSGSGYRLTAGVEHSFAAGSSLKISPYLYYWSVQQSTTQTFPVSNDTMAVWEPSNTSTTYGVNVAYVF